MSDGGYEDHCRRESLNYLLAYEEWENSLSAEERVLLGRAAGPDWEDFRAAQSRRMVTGALGDAAERVSASYLPDMALDIDTDVERMAEVTGMPLEMSEKVSLWVRERVDLESARRESRAITAIAGAFLKGANSKLLAAGLAYASDLAITSGMGTMQAWASQNGVSRAAVSKVAKFWQRELGLPAGSHMRDEQKCRAYSEAQLKKHWRNAKMAADVALEAEGQ